MQVLDVVKIEIKSRNIIALNYTNLNICLHNKNRVVIFFNNKK